VPAHFFKGNGPAFQLFYFTKDLFCFFGIIPEGRIEGFFLKEFQVVFLAIVVKETPLTRGCGHSTLLVARL
jgi:hypothetical protein